MALKESKDGQLTLKEIMAWIEDHFPFFKYEAKQSWRVSGGRCFFYPLSIVQLRGNRAVCDLVFFFWQLLLCGVPHVYIISFGECVDLKHNKYCGQWNHVYLCIYSQDSLENGGKSKKWA